MRKTTNENIPYYWEKNQAARNGNGSYTTDGTKLYSYALMIGDTNEKGEKILFDYRAGTTLGMQSMTTSQHVSKAVLSCDYISDGVTLVDRFKYKR
ncbi:MAG: hypothetical protein HOJ16_00110 [Candidatus Peribacter sp.]|nr:hypothetical protein [Candidatus Peribacter sp.]